MSSSSSNPNPNPTIGVLALQGAFEEHQICMEKATGCKTVQVGFMVNIWLFHFVYYF